MHEETDYKFSNSVLFAPLTAVLLIWTVFWAEVRLESNFDDFGIYPRTLSGLRGILFSPFIHGSIEHLYNNTLPIAILTAALFYFYKKISYRVLMIGILATGLITWCIGRPSYHIGASGVIYLLASFIFFKGIFTKYYRLVALSLGVVFIYGSLLWYIFPIEDNISWEGHLAGFVTGLALAVILRVKVPSVPKYAWEKEDYKEEEDPFLQHFDKDGNFIESREVPRDTTHGNIKITYHLKEEGRPEEGYPE